MSADSPRLFFELLEAFDVIDLKQTIADYFHEAPVLSLAKTAQRRLPADAVGGWHQDAAVYGEKAHSLDVWLPVSRCGDIAPGLALWPRRLDYVVGTVGAGTVDFGTDPEAVAALTEEVAPVCPVFDPGDAAILDELTLHSTYAASRVHAAAIRLRGVVLRAVDVSGPRFARTDRLLAVGGLSRAASARTIEEN